MPLSELGFRRHVMQTREPLLIDQDVRGAAERFGNPVIGSGEMPKSVLYVPLVADGKATGAISIQNFDREHAFAESDQQLLATLARSLSVALENARLVHETRKRNAELAVINSVQEALAGELELQAIYDVVGDKIRDVFDAQVVDISVYEEKSGLVHFPYSIERGVRFFDEPIEPTGFRKHVMETRETLLINEGLADAAERYGSKVISGEMPRSVLFVPLVSGGRVIGVISLQNIDREHAFSESERRLLETLARSLSVALENARLMHETRQRNAELALINSVQEALAGELELQAIYDLVGDRIQEIFDAQSVLISMLDETTGQLVIPYSIERGERLEWEPMPLGGWSKYVLHHHAPLMINEAVVGEAARRGVEVRTVGGAPKSILFVPLVMGGTARGAVSLQNTDREH